MAIVSSTKGSGRKRVIDRKFAGDRSPRPRGRLDGHAAAEEHDAFLHSHETTGPRYFQGDLRIEAATPVFDLNVQLVHVSPDAHGYTGHTGVACGIGQRLLYNSVRTGLDLGGKAPFH